MLNLILISKKAIKILILKLLATLIVFIINIYIARTLSVEEFGEYSLIISVSNILVVYFIFGLDITVLRLVTLYKKANKNKVKGLYIFALTAITINFMIFGLLIYEYLKENIKYELVALVHMIIFSYILAMIAVTAAFIQALNQKHIVISQANQLARSAILGLVLIYFLFINQIEISISNLMVLNNISALFTLLIFTSILIRDVSWGGIVNISSQINLKWIKESFLIFIISVQGVVITQLPILGIGYIQGSVSAAFFAVSMKITGLIVFGISAINAVIAPQIAKAYQDKKIHELESIIKRASTISFYYSIVTLVIILIGGEYLLGMFGKDYIDTKNIMIVLALGHVLDSYFGSVGLVLTMTGKQKVLIKVGFLVLTISIIPSYMLIKSLDTIGAAISTAGIYLVWNLFSYLKIKKDFNINTLAVIDFRKIL